jgi:hypothetical protein
MLRRSRPGFLLAVNSICHGIGLLSGIWCAYMTAMLWQISEPPVVQWSVATVFGLVAYALGRFLSVPLVIPIVSIIQDRVHGRILRDIEERRQGLLPAEANAKILLDGLQWPSEYTTLRVWGEQWPAWIRRQRLSNSLFWVSTACAVAALIGGTGWLVQVANGSSSPLLETLFGYISIVGATLYGLSALLAKLLPRLNLTNELVYHLSQKALHRAPPIMEAAGHYLLTLPLGTDLQLSVNGTQLYLTVVFPGLPASIELIDQEILPLEDEDIDVGERAFDRATVVLPSSGHHGSACPTAWITNEVRTLSLALLNFGRRIDSEGFSAAFDLTDGDTVLKIARVTPLMDAMGETCRQLARLSIQKRVHQALLTAASEHHRGLLVKEVGQLPSEKVRSEIATKWVSEGDGPSRTLMLSALTTTDAVETLVWLIGNSEETSELRTAAFVRLFELAPDTGVHTLGETLAMAASGDGPSVDLVNNFCMILSTLDCSASVQRNLFEQISGIQIPPDVRPALAMMVCRWSFEAPGELSLKRVRMWIESAPRMPNNRTLEQLAYIADQATHQILVTTARVALDEVKARLK